MKRRSFLAWLIALPIASPTLEDVPHVREITDKTLDRMTGNLYIMSGFLSTGED